MIHKYKECEIMTKEEYDRRERELIKASENMLKGKKGKCQWEPIHIRS